VSKNWGGLGKIWGPVPPGPNVEPLLIISREKAQKRKTNSGCLNFEDLVDLVIYRESEIFPLA